MALMALLFALFFVGIEASEADHDCSGEHCPVCQILDAARTLSKNLLSAGSLAALFFAAAVLLEKTARGFGSLFTKNSLVSLKVKLSN